MRGAFSLPLHVVMSSNNVQGALKMEDRNKQDQ